MVLPPRGPRLHARAAAPRIPPRVPPASQRVSAVGSTLKPTAPRASNAHLVPRPGCPYHACRGSERRREAGREGGRTLAASPPLGARTALGSALARTPEGGRGLPRGGDPCLCEARRFLFRAGVCLKASRGSLRLRKPRLRGRRLLRFELGVRVLGPPQSRVAAEDGFSRKLRASPRKYPQAAVLEATLELPAQMMRYHLDWKSLVFPSQVMSYRALEMGLVSLLHF